MASSSSSQLTLLVASGPSAGEAVTISSSERAVVGRKKGSTLWLRDANVSERHAELCFEEGSWLLSDAHSSNGTTISREDGCCTQGEGRLRAVVLAVRAWGCSFVSARRRQNARHTHTQQHTQTGEKYELQDGDVVCFGGGQSRAVVIIQAEGGGGGGQLTVEQKLLADCGRLEASIQVHSVSCVVCFLSSVCVRGACVLQNVRGRLETAAKVCSLVSSSHPRPRPRPLKLQQAYAQAMVDDMRHQWQTKRAELLELVS